MKFSAFIALLAAPFNTVAQARSVIDQAVLQAKAITALFVGATLDADEILAGPADGLKTKIELLVNNAVSARETALNATHMTALETLATSHATALTTAATAKDTELLGYLASVGIRVAKFDKTTVEAGLKAHAEARGQELLAARGIKPLPEKLADPAEATATLTTDAQIAEAYLKLKTGSAESIAFVEQHREALWRHNSAR